MTGTVYLILSLGPMCSNRLCCFDFDVTRDPENPKKITMVMSNVKRPVPDGCVEVTCFKYGVYEQVGNDVVAHEAQTMDLKGYFPKSLMNKL